MSRLYEFPYAPFGLMGIQRCARMGNTTSGHLILVGPRSEVLRGLLIFTYPVRLLRI
jgi:hypothetical protein